MSKLEREDSRRANGSFALIELLIRRVWSGMGRREATRRLAAAEVRFVVGILGVITREEAAKKKKKKLENHPKEGMLPLHQRNGYATEDRICFSRTQLIHNVTKTRLSRYNDVLKYNAKTKKGLKEPKKRKGQPKGPGRKK
ncbi:hypothetical protein L202_03221 [Cryptococcus amylolentus CBS 6039]|uniref:Uncharacterized protein n=2 Tax=Cryptococcus amylolentus TaxID=104669 RepID=A0A1E3HXS3_9TREE|nr:hypothetical protein L202_03221 [Cryptococcus amylolentus CBS 6039]ODN81130.1 hypothetical protein L202_03221 [Cryptococcus amylolentus CBS 6039]ODO09584.1 hypothetical protein I350_03188 [Cryptococcus amylolentus CBS 6273]